MVTPHIGGVLTSLATTILAFLTAGLVVLATGHNPLQVYKAIFEGSGLNWIFPWVTGNAREDAAFNLQQTLLLTATLILTGLAVAFAFRCGLFNIGGQGQWTMGAIVSVWVGLSWAGIAGPRTSSSRSSLATLAGAAWAGIAGFLKATVGAHEVITTIMLNWIAYWIGTYLFGPGDRCRAPPRRSPISDDIVPSAHLPVIWGDAALQGLHDRHLHRARRARRLLADPVAHDPGLPCPHSRPQPRGRPLRRHQRAQQLLPGDGDLGRLRRASPGRWTSWAGSTGSACTTSRSPQSATSASRSRCSGGNTALGVMFAALLFGALLYGTSSRSLDPTSSTRASPATSPR